MSEIQKKYEGKVVVTGMNVFEEREPVDDSYLAKIDQYLADMGDKMAFRVAADGPEGTIAKTWMTASESGGIPTSFLVKDGKILWIGHPMGGLDKAIDQILAGTYDLGAATAKDAQRRASTRAQRELTAPLSAAMKAKDYAKVVEEIDKIVAKDATLELRFGMAKFNALAQIDETKANSYVEKLAFGPAKDNAGQLNGLAWMMVDDKSTLKKPDFALAQRIAERAAELVKDTDSFSPYILDTLAYACYKNGNLDRAIEVQSKALKLAEGFKDFPEETLKEIRDRMDMMKAKKKASGGGGG